MSAGRDGNVPPYTFSSVITQAHITKKTLSSHKETKRALLSAIPL